MYANQYLAKVRHDELARSAAQGRLIARIRHQHSPQRQRTITQLPPRPRTANRKTAHRGRLATVLAAIISGLLASAATIPAAFARVLPDSGAGYVAPPSVPPQVQVRTIIAGGMPGWQITLIALGAALIAAAATVLLTRALAAHRAASATSA